jgi:uncharacterized membrane protein
MEITRNSFHGRIANFSVPILASAWGILLLSPLLLSSGWYSAGILLHSSFSTICHQIPDRCFHWLGYPLPICARCLGLFSGFTIGWLFTLLQPPNHLQQLPGRRWVGAGLALLAIDACMPLINFYSQDHWTRFFTGAVFGLVFAPYVHYALSEVHFQLNAKHQGVTT